MVGFTIIMLMLVAGDLISTYTGNLLSGSIVGMLLLTLNLQFRLVRLDWVKPATKLFERWMSLLFVPIGVGLVEHMDKMQSALPALLITCVLATLALLALVGHLTQWRENKDQAVEISGE